MMFASLAAILAESQRLKKENRSLRAFARKTAKWCRCDASLLDGCQYCEARELLARLDKTKKKVKA